ncbi:hypothetical protein HZH66_001065 [Vespula vulgaris]|uniref:Uncharacterized protein n=1 Tax=Vespula vulgaris TaxID=7454 RepID=A0A834KVR8_VESVU|nr:hypothetical protein HZH66_001065 [Vespula vulgaris]
MDCLSTGQETDRIPERSEEDDCGVTTGDASIHSEIQLGGDLNCWSVSDVGYPYLKYCRIDPDGKGKERMKKEERQE